MGEESAVGPVEVRHVPQRHRYEITVDGHVAGHAEYEEEDGALVFTHTLVAREYGGRGLATRLITEALDEVRREGRRIVPVCPFVEKFVEEHPGYQDLVAS